MLEFHFPARGALPPVTLHWQGRGKPAAEVLQPSDRCLRGGIRPPALMIVGERGCIYTNVYGTRLDPPRVASRV